eukprot:SAG11_NODE_2102_length_3820_cov_2.233808_4_plen_99_part_00
MPGIYAKNVYGATFEGAQRQAETLVEANEYPTAAADYSTEPFSVQPNPHVSTVQMEGKVKVSGYGATHRTWCLLSLIDLRCSRGLNSDWAARNNTACA